MLWIAFARPSRRDRIPWKQTNTVRLEQVSHLLLWLVLAKTISIASHTEGNRQVSSKQYPASRVLSCMNSPASRPPPSIGISTNMETYEQTPNTFQIQLSISLLNCIAQNPTLPLIQHLLSPPSSIISPCLKLSNIAARHIHKPNCPAPTATDSTAQTQNNTSEREQIFCDAFPAISTTGSHYHTDQHGPDVAGCECRP